MPDEDFKKLAKLSKREREVLWLVCEGTSYEEISKKLYISIPTVKANMGRVYVKLGIDQMNKAERIKAIHQIFCPLMKSVELPPEAPEPPAPEPVPAHIIQMVDEDERSIVPFRSNPNDIIVIQTPPTRPPRRFPWLLLVGLILILGTIIIFIVFSMNREPSQLATELTKAVAQLTQAAAVPPTIKATQEPVQPTIPPVKQPTAIVPATQPPAPTNPPASPVPTLPPAPSIVLPFSDNFDAGPKSQWKIFSGNWIALNGKYTTAENDNGWSLSALDDPTWKNYRIQVNVNIPHMGAASQGKLGVIVRISSGQSQYFGFTIDGLSRGSWSNVNVGDPYAGPIAGYGNFKVPDQFLLDIEVRGNQFIARVNGQEIQKLSTSGYDGGGIALAVYCSTDQGCPGFDNLKIDPLP